MILKTEIVEEEHFHISHIVLVLLYTINISTEYFHRTAINRINEPCVVQVKTQKQMNEKPKTDFHYSSNYTNVGESLQWDINNMKVLSFQWLIWEHEGMYFLVGERNMLTPYGELPLYPHGAESKLFF